MQRRSFFRTLFGGVLAGLAAPRVVASAAKPIVVIDPASPWYAARQVAKFKPLSPPVYHYFPMEGGYYKAGDTFSIGRRRIVSLDRPTGYAEVEVRDILLGGAPRP